MDSSFDLGALLKKHKPKPKHLSNMAEGVQRRLTSVLRYNKSMRMSVFDRVRNLPVCPSPPRKNTAQQKVEQRVLQLQKWKEEKEKKKREEAAKKKRPFLAGVPHAPLTYIPLPPPKVMPSTSGRVTRSQSARMNTAKQIPETKNTKSTVSFAPKNAGFQPKIDVPKYVLNNQSNKRGKTNYVAFEPVLPKNKTKPLKQAEVLLPKKNSTEKEKTTNEEAKTTEKDAPVKAITTKRTPRKNAQKVGKNVMSKNLVPKSESSSEEKLRSPKSPQSKEESKTVKSSQAKDKKLKSPRSPHNKDYNMVMTPDQVVEQAKKISPCVTMSRGKDNARKEIKKKLEEGLLDEDSCDEDNVGHFRRQLKSEVDRLTELANTWDEVLLQTQLPEVVYELGLSAVGQARLLVSQKLQQFASLVERCAKPEPGQALVTCLDLAGFWDMVFMQVENVELRFKKLEEYRARGWAEERPADRRPAARRHKARGQAPRAPPAGGPSKLRDLIAAARKAKQQTEVQPNSPPKAVIEGESKSFEGGFFSVQSPVRSPASFTPNKPSLLKAVLSSEAQKSVTKSSTSFAMLRASMMAKNVDMEGITPLEQTPIKLTPINFSATPGRSILKSEINPKSTGKKSIKVLFDDSYETKDLIDDQNHEIIDSGVSSMDTDEKENKRKPKLTRQLATEDSSPVMTRSRRKSMQTPKETEDCVEIVTPRRSSRRQRVLQEVEINIEKSQTPKRSSRRKRSEKHGAEAQATVV